MIVRHFFEGGTFFMFLIYAMWITVFTLVVRYIVLYRSGKNLLKLKKTNDSVLFIGSFAFLFGAFGQMLGLVHTFDSAQRIGEVGISPNQIAGGFKVTFIPLIYGFALFLISGIIWFVCRNLKYTEHLEE